MKVPALRGSGLRFSYEPAREPVRWAIDDLDFTVEAGDFWGVIGPNGSGKSSLLKLIAKLCQPTAGSLSLFGAPLVSMTQDEVARQVAFVPQDTTQVFPFTVAEIVLMGRFPHHLRKDRLRPLSFFGWESGEDRARARWAMEQADVAHLAGRLVQELSGGERQRTMIARALAQNPRMLLLDESTAFLDLHHQVDICRILRTLNEQQGLTVIFVSHDLNLAGQYSDRLLLLEKGRAVRAGAPCDVIDAELLHAVYRCRVLVDQHPVSGLPRVTLPGRAS